MDGRTKIAIEREAKKLGFDLDWICPTDLDLGPTWMVFDIYEQGEDSENIGRVVSDGQTYQWRNVYSRVVETGEAAQGRDGLKKLLARVSDGLGPAVGKKTNRCALGV